MTWHPHCTSLVDFDGQRVDVTAIPRSEWDESTVTRCELIDLDHGYLETVEWPEAWTCPKCGGTDFEFVRADYMPSGL